MKLSSGQVGSVTPLEAGIRAWTDGALAPAFWRPARLEVESAWFGHVPFAHWIVAAHRPSSIVELGTHNGVSYSAFCEAVLRERLNARAVAIDTWRGDEHAGFYGEDVLRQLRRFHDQRYASFSTLMQATFDEAQCFIEDDSVDLLHIDGRHGYDDVAHDFATWRKKLSPRGVVLFHDTNVRERDFGVWRLWAELRAEFPSFEFLHSHGLGVLAIGPLVDGSVASLCALREGSLINTVRERFAMLGERWVSERAMLDLRQEVSEVRAALAQAGTWGQAAQDEVNRLFPLNQQLTQAHRQTRARLAQAQYEIASADLRLADAESRVAEANKQNTDLAGRLSDQQAAQARLREELASLADHAASITARFEEAAARIEAHRQLETTILNSKSWRMTAPLRKVSGILQRRRLEVSLDLPSIAGPDPAPVGPAGSPVHALPPHEAIEPANPTSPPGTEQLPRALFVSGEDHTPGHVYRIERYTETARKLGFDARWKAAAHVGLEDLLGLALTVIWRAPYSDHIGRVISISRDQGATVIYDVDDLMFRPELAVAKTIDAIRVQRLSEDATQAFFYRISKALLECDLVTCPTEELAHQARRLGRPAYVLPNGFDTVNHAVSRRAMRDWNDIKDDVLRIGYASGTRTHQRDFAVAVPAIARILRENALVRLTLFVDASSGEGVVLAHEFPELTDLADRIEWRALVKLSDLPKELARFSINIAPLEPNNEFCEAKSELKFFEAALAGVPTVASPTGPFRRAIIDGVTGILADSDDAWYAALTDLLGNPEKRARIARAAYHASLACFGPEARTEAFSLMLDQWQGGAAGAAAFERQRYRATLPRISPPNVPESETLFLKDRRGEAEVTIIVPTYNYADFVVETLHSVAGQTLQTVDLVVVDDCSTDDSVHMVLDWAAAHEDRFNRIAVLRHRVNSGLGFTRNSGFAAAETPFVLPLDADNRLRPSACHSLLSHLASSDAAFAYPRIQQFGDRQDVFSATPYSVLRLQPGNYIDAMALIRKTAWAAAGGYDHIKLGWEDFDFWCRLAERGLYGLSVPEVLADYRVHSKSMLHTMIRNQDNQERLGAELNQRHPWLDVRQPSAQGR
jgi:glycosyltransferase involved in cell wall biosynthesis